MDDIYNLFDHMYIDDLSDTFIKPSIAYLSSHVILGILFVSL